MSVSRIESLDDPRLEPYRDIRHTNWTRQSGRFIAEGRLVVERLLASSYEVESVLIDERHLASLAASIPDEVTVLETPHELIDRIVGFHFHRGVLAAGRRKPLVNLRDEIGEWPERATIVAVDAVMDPENLGNILRNAAAFGVDLVILGPRSADPFSRRVLRVSMGNVLRLRMAESHDLAADLRWLGDQAGVQFAATVLADDAVPLPDSVRVPRFGLVFGNEGIGMTDEAASACSFKVTLPMRLGTDSLNVAVASGVFLYHFTHVARIHAASEENPAAQAHPTPRGLLGNERL